MNIYKDILNTLQGKDSNTWFDTMIQSFVKNNDFESLRFLLKETKWTSQESTVASALFDSIAYKKPGFKVFKILYDLKEFKELKHESFIYSIENQKKDYLHKIIKNIVFYKKTKLLPHLKDFANEEFIDFCIIEASIKYPEMAVKFREKIKNFIYYENIKPINSEFYQNRKILSLIALDCDVIDTEIKKIITDKQIVYCIENLFFKRKIDLTNKWHNYFINKTNEIQSFEILNRLKPKTSKQTLFLKEKNINVDNRVKNLIIKAIVHNKLGYLKKVKETFKVEYLIDDDSMMYYFMKNNSKAMHEFLKTQIIESNFNLKSRLNAYQQNINGAFLLKDYEWSEIEESTKNWTSVQKKILLFDYLKLKGSNIKAK